MADNTTARTYGPARMTLEQCLEPHRPQIVQALAQRVSELEPAAEGTEDPRDQRIAELERQLQETRDQLRSSAGELSSSKREPGEFVGPVQQMVANADAADGNQAAGIEQLRQQTAEGFAELDAGQSQKATPAEHMGRIGAEVDARAATAPAPAPAPARAPAPAAPAPAPRAAPAPAPAPAAAPAATTSHGGRQNPRQTRDR